MKHDQFYYILKFLYFSKKMNQLNKNDNYDKLWKMRTLYDQLSDTYAKFYNPSEYLAVDEVTILLKGRAIFKHYIPKKYKCFGIKIYKFCDMTGYICNMRIYMGEKQWQNATQ